MLRRIFLLLFPPALLRATSTDDSPLLTGGALNGRFWNQMTDMQKTLWLSGFRDGVINGLVQLQTFNPDIKAEAIQRSINAICPDTIKTAELIQQITRLYQDSANLRIPASLMTPVATARVQGADERSVELLLQNCRKTATDILKEK